MRRVISTRPVATAQGSTVSNPKRGGLPGLPQHSGRPRRERCGGSNAGAVPCSPPHAFSSPGDPGDGGPVALWALTNGRGGLGLGPYRSSDGTGDLSPSPRLPLGSEFRAPQSPTAPGSPGQEKARRGERGTAPALLPPRLPHGAGDLSLRTRSGAFPPAGAASGRPTASGALPRGARRRPRQVPAARPGLPPPAPHGRPFLRRLQRPPGPAAPSLTGQGTARRGRPTAGRGRRPASPEGRPLRGCARPATPAVPAAEKLPPAPVPYPVLTAGAGRAAVLAAAGDEEGGSRRRRLLPRRLLLLKPAAKFHHAPPRPAAGPGAGACPRTPGRRRELRPGEGSWGPARPAVPARGAPRQAKRSGVCRLPRTAARKRTHRRALLGSRGCPELCGGKPEELGRLHVVAVKLLYLVWEREERLQSLRLWKHLLRTWDFAVQNSVSNDRRYG